MHQRDNSNPFVPCQHVVCRIFVLGQHNDSDLGTSNARLDGEKKVTFKVIDADGHIIIE
jgi:hypothetical protein